MGAVQGERLAGLKKRRARQVRRWGKDDREWKVSGQHEHQITRIYATVCCPIVDVSHSHPFSGPLLEHELPLHRHCAFGRPVGR